LDGSLAVGNHSPGRYELGASFAESWNGKNWKILALPAVPGIIAVS
jgi:hypothetical protein